MWFLLIFTKAPCRGSDRNAPHVSGVTPFAKHSLPWHVTLQFTTHQTSAVSNPAELLPASRILHWPTIPVQLTWRLLLICATRQAENGSHPAPSKGGRGSVCPKPTWWPSRKGTDPGVWSGDVPTQWPHGNPCFKALVPQNQPLGALVSSLVQPQSFCYQFPTNTNCLLCTRSDTASAWHVVEAQPQKSRTHEGGRASA